MLTNDQELLDKSYFNCKLLSRVESKARAASLVLFTEECQKLRARITAELIEFTKRYENRLYVKGCSQRRDRAEIVQDLSLIPILINSNKLIP